MLTVVSGSTATARQILIYSVLLVPVSMLPCVFGFAGPIYGATAVLCGAILVVLALQVGNSGSVDRKAARRLFGFSILYLFVLFAALLASGSDRASSIHYRSADCSGLERIETSASPTAIGAPCSCNRVREDEVDHAA